MFVTGYRGLFQPPTLRGTHYSLFELLDRVQITYTFQPPTQWGVLCNRRPCAGWCHSLPTFSPLLVGDALFNHITTGSS